MEALDAFIPLDSPKVLCSGSSVYSFFSEGKGGDLWDSYHYSDNTLMQKTLFSIKVGAAAEIKAYSAYAAEDELLLFPGTIFEVLNVLRLSRLDYSAHFAWPVSDADNTS